MSTALVVGGDYIDGISHVLNSYGIAEVANWLGRKAGSEVPALVKSTEVSIAKI